MASLISRAWGYLTGNARLIIEYVLIMAIIVLGVYAVMSHLQTKALTQSTADLNQRLGSVKTTLDQQVQTNADQDKAIAHLKELRELDSQALDGLHHELDKAGAKGRAARDKVSQLEKTNAAAKDLLDTAVPAALGCVLDGTTCAGSSGDQPHGGAGGSAK